MATSAVRLKFGHGMEYHLEALSTGAPACQSRSTLDTAHGTYARVDTQYEEMKFFWVNLTVRWVYWRWVNMYVRRMKEKSLF